MLSWEQEEHLKGIVEKWFYVGNESAPQKLVDSGMYFPTAPPSIYETLPDEWESLMDVQGGISNLNNGQLEGYLEKWTRLLGYAYFLQGVWRDRVDTLERTQNYVEKYIEDKATGGREARSAAAGSHYITQIILDKLNDCKRPLNILEGHIRRWEKIEFAISRAITIRSK